VCTLSGRMIHSQRGTEPAQDFSFRQGQHDALRSITSFLCSDQPASYILATGSFGKTVLYIKAVEEYRKLRPENNGVLVLADSVNLLNQLQGEFQAFAPQLSLARASRHDPSPQADVVFASLQRCRRLHSDGTLSRLLRPLIIVDEAHTLLGQHTQEMTRSILGSGSRILGGTATDEYFSEKKLSDLLGKPCFNLTYQEALELRVVTPFTTSAIGLPFDMSKVRRLGGDYDSKALAAVFPAERCAEAIARYHLQYMQGKKGFVQCLSREHAKKTAAVLIEHGIKAAAITGDLPEGTREREIARAKRGEIDVLCGAKLLIQGIDWPAASVAYNFPSTSALAVKQRGFRVTRLDPANPEKCASIVEILPTVIAKTRPPMIFREAITGGIVRGGGFSPGRSGPVRLRESGVDDPSGFFPDEASASAIIDEVLRGSGAWGRLHQQMPTPERVHELVVDLHTNIKEFLEELAAGPRLKDIVKELSIEVVRDRSKAHLPPVLSEAVNSAIQYLSDTDVKPDIREKALAEIQRFLFAPLKYRANTNSVSALGLSPSRLQKLLPRCFELSESEWMTQLIALPQFTAVLKVLAAERAWHSGMLEVNAIIPKGVTQAIHRLNRGPHSSEEQKADQDIIKSFLFSELTRSTPTGALEGLGFTPESLQERLREVLPCRVSEKTIASLKVVDDCAHTLAESFEPLIECQAILQGLKDKPEFQDSEWYSRGAETLIRSLYLLDGSDIPRLQTYLQNRIAKEFTRILEKARESRVEDSQQVIEFMDPAELIHVPSRGSVGTPLLPENWYELAEKRLEVYAQAATQEEVRLKRSICAEVYMEALNRGEEVPFEYLSEVLSISESSVRNIISNIRKELQMLIESIEPSIAWHGLGQAHRAEPEIIRAGLIEGLHELSCESLQVLYDCLRYAADPFSQSGEQLRAYGGILKPLSKELLAVVGESKLPGSYKEILQALIRHLSLPNGAEAKDPALFMSDAFRTHGWRGARDAIECLLIASLWRIADINGRRELWENFPFTITHQHLLAVGVEPSPAAVILDFLQNSLRFHLVEYSKATTAPISTPIGICTYAMDRIPGGAAWVGGEEVGQYFRQQLTQDLFGRTLQELSVMETRFRHDPLFLSYLSLAMSTDLKLPASVRESATKFISGNLQASALKLLLVSWLSAPLKTLKANPLLHPLIFQQRKLAPYGDVFDASHNYTLTKASELSGRHEKFLRSLCQFASQLRWTPQDSQALEAYRRGLSSLTSTHI
jgi:superfamily II DNA or RNA helicase